MTLAVSAPAHPRRTVEQVFVHYSASTQVVTFRAAMPIPGFIPDDGMLPEGQALGMYEDEPITWGWPCTAQDIESRFVTAYTGSLSRAALHHHCEQLIQLARSTLQCIRILVSGAFVTDITDPYDIHIVLNALGGDIDNLGGPDRLLIDYLFDSQTHYFGESDSLQITTDFARTYPNDHPKFEVGAAEMMMGRLHAEVPVSGQRIAGYLEFFDCAEGGEATHEVFKASPH